jgi:molybdopterin synthase sulfur carrier subunit
LEGGKVRGFVNIYLNEEDIRLLKAEETLVRDGDEVYILPAIAGE